MQRPGEALEENVACGDDGAPIATVTRSADGCLVLNTARSLIVDVDLVAPPSRTRTTIFSVFFGATAPKPKSVPIEPPRQVRDWIEAGSKRGVRIYRTATGLRYLVTHATFDPAAAETDRLMARLGSDRPARRQIRERRSFRSRLTPEPWRVGIEEAAVELPLAGEADRLAFASWLARYEAACAGHATCSLLIELGDRVRHPEVESIVALHDQRTRAASGLPLA